MIRVRTCLARPGWCRHVTPAGVDGQGRAPVELLHFGAWLGRYQSGALTYQSFRLDEVQTRLHGEAAIVTARQTSPGHYQGQPTPEISRVTLVAVRDTARWQLAGAHNSFMAGTPGSPPLPVAAHPPAEDQDSA